jgi:serine/threonine-protein kinase
MEEKSVSHYRILAKIGEGGMGVVYRASDSKLGREVALKMLPAAFLEDPERLARFRREAQVLASLNHPHIGAIYGLEESGNERALVLELVEGPTLEERIQAGAIPLDETLRIARQIADALEAAHERGVVHRDLKPANVKLTPDGRVKVLDFGLAKALEGDRPMEGTGLMTQSPTITGHLTAANVILGTAAYMSPEQARGKNADKRADIWAWGVILFEMLTGKRLFAGETISDTLASVLKTDPEWSALPESTPAPILRMLRRCMQRDPSKRLRDIGDARITIDEVLAGDMDAAPALVAAAPVGTSSRRWIVAVAGTAIVVAALAAGLAWTMKPARTQLPVRKFEVPLADASASSGAGTTLAISADGRRMAYTAQARLWVRDLDHLEATEVPRSAEALSPFWSPDGNVLGFFVGSRLWKWPVSGGDPTLICELGESSSNAASGAWLTAEKIVFCTGSSDIKEVLAQGGDAKAIVKPDTTSEEDFHNISALPGGRGFVFVVHRKEGGYDTIDCFDGRERKRVLQMADQSLSHPMYSATGHIVFAREPGNRGVWAVPFSPSKLEPTGEPFLVAPEGGAPAVADDGTLLYVRGRSTQTSQLVWVSRSGNVEGTIGEKQQMYPSPRLSPDGGRVAVRATEGDDRDIWIYDTARGTRTRFTFEQDLQDYPDWSPDGKWIYYQEGTSSNISIMARRSDGTGSPHEIVPGGYFSVSPDGKYLLYIRYNGKTWDLWYALLGPDATLAGEPKILVKSATASYVWPQLSPNGRYVAYSADESGKDEIYLKEFPSGQGKWQASTQGGIWPRWSRDGKELFYSEGDKLISVPIEYEPALSLGAPKVLFTHENSGVQRVFGWPDAFDVSPDGKRFVFLRKAEDEKQSDAEPGIVIAQNWFAQFARKG